ncbi:MAG: polysaccharide pyruvyl transferase family protein [Candidatus Zhuqueibacterota bacterium]
MEKLGKKNPLKIAILGASLATENMGVSALAASLIKIILEVNHDAEISLVMGSRSSASHWFNVNGKTVEVKIINHRLSLHSEISKHLVWIFILAILQALTPFHFWQKKIIHSNLWLQTIWNSDFVGDIRGGDSFSDIYGLKRFLKGVVPIFILLLLKKDFVLLPQTYGPYQRVLSKKIAKFILRRASTIYARDKFSVELIKQIIDDPQLQCKIRFCPDVAFKLDAIPPEKIDLAPPLEQDAKSTLIGINVNGLVYHGGYSRDNMFHLNFNYKIFLQQLIEAFLEIENCEILLIPHAFAKPGNVNSDPEACQQIFENNLQAHVGKIHLVNGKYNQNEIKGIIKLCDFFIGTRMHACIAAMSMGIPTISVAYSGKFKGVFESIGLGEWVVDARKETLASSLDFVMDKFMHRTQHLDDIRQRIDEAKSLTITEFRGMLSN